MKDKGIGLAAIAIVGLAIIWVWGSTKAKESGAPAGPFPSIPPPERYEEAQRVVDEWLSKSPSERTVWADVVIDRQMTNIMVGQPTWAGAEVEILPYATPEVVAISREKSREVEEALERALHDPTNTPAEQTALWQLRFMSISPGI